MPAVFAVVTLTATFALSATAVAQAAPAESAALNDEGGEVTQVGPTRAITYDDGEDLVGDLPRPSGERITARHSPKHPSLIQLRVRFNDHLIRLSADI